MYEVLILTFALGVLTKSADIGGKSRFSYLAGGVYGVLAAYILSNYPVLAPLGLSIVLAVLLTGKIDTRAHAFGIAFMLLFLGVWGFRGVDLILLVIFLLAGVADEIMNDLADSRRIKGKFARIFGKRVILEITAFFVSFLTNEWLMFLGMISYDTGYVIAGAVSGRFK